MRGDAVENVAAETEGASAETQPRVVTLRQMLKKASQNSFPQQYTTLVSSPSDSSGSSVNEPQKDDEPADVSAAASDGTDDNQHSGQNGVHVDPARMNPFYAYYLESGSKGHVTENVEREASEGANLYNIFVPPPEFQSSPLDLQPEIHGEEPENDLFPPFVPSHVENLLHTATATRKESADGPHHEETLISPDLFNVNPQTENISRASHSEGGGFLQAAEGAAPAEELNLFVDPFKSPPHKVDDLLQSSQPKVGNPFYTGSTDEADLFPTKSGELFHMSHKQDPSTGDFDLFNTSYKENLDVFSSPSTNTFDPFSSPVERNLFQDVSGLDDPFGATPSKQGDPFQEVSNGTPDLFSPLPSNSSTGFSPPSLNSTSETKRDMLSSPDLFRATPSDSLPAIQPNSSSRSHDLVLTTPQGTKHSILHPTPFSQARGLSPAEMTHLQSFKRPPKPLPRSRPQRKEKPQIPELPPKPQVPPPTLKPVEPEPAAPKTPPKPAFRPLPVVRRKPKTPESQPVNSENYVVLEDILLIGQEMCVEDWPEDSPQLNPEFRPSGRLRLRRESLKVKMDYDGGSGEDQDASGNQSKKRDKKFRMSLLSRRGTKDKFPDHTKEGRSQTLTAPQRSSKEYFSEEQLAAAENEDELNGLDYRKKPLKNKVTQLLRRASTMSAVRGGKSASEYSPNETKATVLGDSEAEDGAEAQHDEKKKNKMKMKFVPQRGFATTVPKTDDEVKGATGYTPQKGSKGRAFEDGEEIKGFSLQSTSKETDEDFYGYDDFKPKKPAKMRFPHKSHRGSKENVLDEATSQRKKSSLSAEELDADELYGMEYSKQNKSKHKGLKTLQPKAKTSYDTARQSETMARSYHTPQQASHGSFMGDRNFQETDEDFYGYDDFKPKKPAKMRFPHKSHRGSKENVLDEATSQRKKSSLSAEELDADELYGMEYSKQNKSKHKGLKTLQPKAKTSYDTARQSETMARSYHTPQQASHDDFAEDEFTGNLSTSKGEMYYSEQYLDDTSKPKKTLKLKGFKKHKAKSKDRPPEWEDPPGFTSGDFMSEAAMAEWMAAQQDERAMAGFQDECEDGDTDSLMEWWNTVEQWDELPSDDENRVVHEDESRSFSALADKVHRGLRVFNKVFTERAEVLWQSIILLHAITDDISDFHKKAKVAGITTTAVGGVAAIAGLALAPFTFGASLVITAVGVGVATAGGIASASVAMSDNSNNMHDRKKVEIALKEYEGHLLDLGKILHFIDKGLYKLRGHPFLRSGTQHYSENWETRRAVQIISLVDSPVMRATEITDGAIASVQGLFRGMDKFFVKDSRELKKGCRRKVVAQIKDVANVLNTTVVELNTIREELQDATGNV
ncbi:uncharacterized protein si:cabz01007807.1 [Hippoglossus stenolepis]|uniref:uncharacterized protein si:cabz01007807.1 n=1 Tax=Hippoglossus stenolepis TaxID=195615 RepID=UPI001FAFB465|nr:uncharacterized protein si:cabz01007807.1 [Hippoglossus stenolepis]